MMSKFGSFSNISIALYDPLAKLLMQNSMIGNIMRMFTFLLPIVAVFRRGVNEHARSIEEAEK